MDEEKISQFCSVTGATPDRATFFLESSGWNVQTAIDSFYDASAGDGEEVEEVDGPATSPPTIQSHQQSNRGRQPASNSRFGTMASMLSRSERGEEEDEDKAQEFFAGGSERSGQMITGPPKKKTRPADMAQSVFEGAREHGATQVDDESPSQQSRPTFKGAGYRLGETPEESKLVSMPEPVAAEGAPQKTRTLTFWKNGFNVDDGPLRDGQSEEDRALLASVSRGEIPAELRTPGNARDVHINIVDQRDSEYVLPKKKVAAFSGSGQRLGSPAPGVSFDAQTGSSVAAAAISAATVAASSHVVDTAKPVTSLQIRLADGTRLTAKFNHDHTVGSIRSFINESRPGMAEKTYCLMTTFPNKELTDNGASLADAKLINAVVVQRMK